MCKKYSERIWDEIKKNRVTNLRRRYSYYQSFFITSILGLILGLDQIFANNQISLFFVFLGFVIYMQSKCIFYDYCVEFKEEQKDIKNKEQALKDIEKVLNDNKTINKIANFIEKCLK